MRPLIILLLVSLFVFTECRGKKSVQVKVDDWYKYPTNIGMYKEMKIKYYVVKNPEEFDMASAKLINSSFFILQNETIKKVYIRALSYTNNEDGYTFYQFEDTLWINHFVLTNQTVMKRHILVFEYAEDIREVYTTCGAAK